MTDEAIAKLMDLLPAGHLKDELARRHTDVLTSLAAQAVMIVPKVASYLKSTNDEMTTDAKADTSVSDISGSSKYPDNLREPNSHSASSRNLTCWMLEEWRRTSLPQWRSVLQESINTKNTKREEYARWMLREVLQDEEYKEPDQ